MAIRGAESKSAITQKILDTFDGAFLYDKEIRIPMNENGEIVQIKCVLTCAKVNVGTDNNATNISTIENSSDTEVKTQTIELTEEEKNNVNTLIEKLGL
jgi:hypothetical protein